MRRKDEKKIKDLIHSHALKNNMTDDEFRSLVESPYEFTYEKMKDINLEDVESEEDFSKLKTNFIYPGFMRLVIDYIALSARNNRRKNINKINKNK